MVKEIRSEDELRKKIIEYLKADKDVIRVDDRCSGIEFGVDITFEKHDYFGVSRLYGIQIKIGNLSSARSRANRSVREIIAQLAISFGNAFPPQDKRLDAIYVVVDGNINPYAQEHIKNARVGFREIYFIDKQELNEYFTRNKAKLQRFEET